jgi:arylsulfatase A-like enzyme
MVEGVAQFIKRSATFMASMTVPLVVMLSTSLAQTASDGPALPREEPPFTGKIAPRFEESTPQWPEAVKAPEGAPNVLSWLADDAGFTNFGSFGALIDTPNIDALASQGLRYNNFHTTALCSPSRAAILAGRNHHSIGLGSHAITAMGFPGYNAHTPRSAATVAKVLQLSGYTTFAAGKWDHTPFADLTVAGPFDRWPSGDGFDHYYGFMSADTDQFAPPMWIDHTPVNPSVGKPDYHVTTDMADKAIEWITAMKSARPDRPWMMYWATGAVHAPHQAPQA